MIANLELTKLKQLTQSVSINQDKEGAAYVLVNHSKASASFSLFGGHLLHFRPQGEQDLVWLSSLAVLDGSKAIRGGAPICWPWFGPAAKELGEGLPSHGFARTSQWQVSDALEQDGQVQLILTLSSNEQTLALWPHQFELTLIATISDSLKLELITKNTDKTAFRYAGALHTYLNISQPDQVSLTGLGTSYVDDLDNKTIKTSGGQLIVDNAIDSVYIEPEQTVVLSDKGVDHQIKVSNQGNDSVVVWTPWIEGAKSMTDMQDDGYKTMFCVESAITGSGVEIAPGDSHSLCTQLSL